jgi:hypothetical protein
MNITQIAASLVILGNILIIAGFGAFPSLIYTGKNIQEKLDLLTAQPRRWVLSQSLLILGVLTLVAGTVFLSLSYLERVRVFFPPGLVHWDLFLGKLFGFGLWDYEFSNPGDKQKMNSPTGYLNRFRFSPC